MTLIGANSTANAHHAAGNHWRRSSKLVVRNSIITGFAMAGVLIESANAASSLADGTSEFKTIWYLVLQNLTVLKALHQLMLMTLH